MTRRLSFSITVVLVLALIQRSQTVTSAQQSPQALPQAIPVQPIGYYDYFGKLLTPEQARQVVVEAGMNPLALDAYRRVGLVHLTSELIARGRCIFLKHEIGDTFGLQQVCGFAAGFGRILPEVIIAINGLRGGPTTNLKIVLLRDLTLGSRTFPRGTTISTGLD